MTLRYLGGGAMHDIRRTLDVKKSTAYTLCLLLLRPNILQRCRRRVRHGEGLFDFVGWNLAQAKKSQYFSLLEPIYLCVKCCSM